MPAAPDLVRRDFTAERPDELWVADITYIPTWEGWLYLAAIIDVFTKRCCGWSMRGDLAAELVVDALGMAVTLRRPKKGHHPSLGPGKPVLLARLGEDAEGIGDHGLHGQQGRPF